MGKLIKLLISLYSERFTCWTLALIWFLVARLGIWACTLWIFLLFCALKSICSGLRTMLRPTEVFEAACTLGLLGEAASTSCFIINAYWASPYPRGYIDSPQDKLERLLQLMVITLSCFPKTTTNPLILIGPFDWRICWSSWSWKIGNLDAHF